MSPQAHEIARAILDDCISNIIHTTLLTQHRAHKTLLSTLDPTTKLPHCPKCSLPQLLDPPLAPRVRGATSDPPRDTNYCDRRPWCRVPGFDIYGNPFPRADVTGRPPTKKEREAAKNNKKDGNDTPASNEGGEANGTAPPSPSADGDAGGGNDGRKVEKGEKKATKIDEKLKKGEYVPWQTCPSCKRSLLVTRFAKHLEQCMGLSGRAASRNAMVKMGGGTPQGSRGGTPGRDLANGNGGGGDEEGGDGDDAGSVTGGGGEVRKKVLKKGMKEKMKKDKEKGVNGKVAKGAGTATPVKRPPGSSTGGGNGNGEGKRDREEMQEDGEDDGDTVHVKKRQKLQRVESTASLGSQSALGTAEKRSESGDGSFVDEGGFDGED